MMSGRIYYCTHNTHRNKRKTAGRAHTRTYDGACFSSNRILLREEVRQFLLKIHSNSNEMFCLVFFASLSRPGASGLARGGGCRAIWQTLSAILNRFSLDFCRPAHNAWARAAPHLRQNKQHVSTYIVLIFALYAV